MPGVGLKQLGQIRRSWSHSHSDGTPPGRALLAWRDICLCHMDEAICAGQASTVHCFLMEGPKDDWHGVDERESP